MRKLFVLPLFLLLVVTGCVDRPLASDVSEAQAKLHAVEQQFANAQKAIISLQRVGVLKGSLLANVKKGEEVAYRAIVVARAAVDSKSASALKVVSDALVAVLSLVAMYTADKVK